MSRGLVLLIVATAAASAQAADSACYSALVDANRALSRTVETACLSLFTADVFAKYNANPNCSVMFANPYDVAACDPIIANISLCAVKAVKLLKADNTFDDAAFKATTLQNKCSADPKFIAAYPKCKNSTMKYLNVSRLFLCLMNAVY
ncbi:uncharacterized protein LOC108680214 isoform X2 [Hyalella azteca]|uniref:Uncharacterized protein LOC108680214 isoform X2 n=1 Tax=Hyalella azteca TaxID=294128 RepID=A0A8B7PFY7_HYAAZ|nr:uncharacterized protein LOC108680214 isoform X2 [Hyalella azteca]